MQVCTVVILNGCHCKLNSIMIYILFMLLLIYCEIGSICYRIIILKIHLLLIACIIKTYWDFVLLWSLYLCQMHYSKKRYIRPMLDRISDFFVLYYWRKLHYSVV